MIFRSLPRYIFILVLSLSSAAAYAADTAHEWLIKINNAVHTLNYDGAFVYQHNTQLEAMRVIHKVENGSARERLVSLNGVAREIIRDGKEIRCYWPDKNSAMVEFRKTQDKNFPSILPDQLQGFDENYVLKLGKTERIAGRTAQLITITPNDGYRYGYHLWADKDSGLLLKAELLDSDGAVLERSMFTQLNVGGKIPDSALRPGVSGEGLVWHRADDKDVKADARQGWTAGQLPRGFRLSMHLTRHVPMREKPVEHLVYTDGLATVSVFIEKQEKEAKPIMIGLRHMGAVHAHGVHVGDFQITVVGEVPAATVSMISESVVPMQKP
jgi:sigma-E factor negative regulatory protein RseB